MARLLAKIGKAWKAHCGSVALTHLLQQSYVQILYVPTKPKAVRAVVSTAGCAAWPRKIPSKFRLLVIHGGAFKLPRVCCVRVCF